jgi:hypothetical protein
MGGVGSGIMLSKKQGYSIRHTVRRGEGQEKKELNTPSQTASHVNRTWLIHMDDRDLNFCAVY